MRAEDQEVEIAAGDKKIKIRGSDILTTVIGMVMAAGMAAVGFMIFDHRAEAKDGAAEIAKALKESNFRIAEALKENNKAIMESIDRLTVEQRRATEAVKEGNCLLSLPQDRRTNASDICKRTARDLR